VSRRLQETGFDRSQYERPDREWVCGRTGNACPLGPDTAGECVATHECVPYREADRWICARPKPFGGECEDGPLPGGACCRSISTCQPTLSVRARRDRTVRWTIAMTIGLLALGLAGNRGLDFIQPGPVTHQHGTIEKDCSSCHSAGVGGPAHWVRTALTGADRESDSERCLGCHNLGESSNIAHSIPSKDLARTTARLEARETERSRPLRFALASIGPGIPVRDGGELACAVCHREHQGAEADLTALTNDQCQVCHLVQFDRFAKDHPALGDYPYGRRTRIAFNHQSHQEDYFPDEDREGFSCVGCHAPEPTGRTMSVLPFETSCNDCHDGDVGSAGKGGMAFFNVPGIDVRGLRGVGINPGQWPHVEKPKAPSPFVDFLLAGDDRLSNEDRKTVAGLGGDFSDVPGKTNFEQLAIGRYVWAMKLLLHDLRTNGHASLEARLRSEGMIGEHALPTGLLSDLLNGLGSETIHAAIDDWFPDLNREVEAFNRITGELDALQDMDRDHWARLNQTLRDLARQRGDSAGSRRARKSPEESWVREGGWYRSQKDAAIRYRSRGHADPFVRAWFDLSGSFAHTGDNAGDAASAAERIFAGLRKTNATGKCSLCHSVDSVASVYGTLGPANAVNWQTSTPEPTRQLPTEFRHQPHFSLDNAEVCDTCHTMREIDSDEFEQAYDDDAVPTGHLLNFSPIELRVCGECHTERAASDNCVTCHNYHLGETMPIYLSATSATKSDDESGDSGDEE